MKQPIAIAILLVGLASVLGATVFRDQVAWAAQSVDAHITNIDDNGNIKVHEQGTATVAISAAANTVQPDLHLNTPFVVSRTLTVLASFGGSQSTTFTVPAGKVFMLQHVAVSAAAPTGVTPDLKGTFRLPNNTPPDDRESADYAFNLLKGGDISPGQTAWGYSQNDAIAIYSGQSTGILPWSARGLQPGGTQPSDAVPKTQDGLPVAREAVKKWVIRCPSAAEALIR
jgi:hypothetical protein